MGKNKGGSEKKYAYERGQFIEGTYIKYIAEAGYRGKHRYILGACDLCATIKEFRMDSITLRKSKSCGCAHRKRVQEGKLRAYTIGLKGYNPYIRDITGRIPAGVCLFLKEDMPNELKKVTLGELAEIVRIRKEADEGKQKEKK